MVQRISQSPISTIQDTSQATEAKPQAEAKSNPQPVAEEPSIVPSPPLESTNMRRLEESLGGQVMASGLRRIRYEQDIPATPAPAQSPAGLGHSTQPLNLSNLGSPPTTRNLEDFFAHRAPHADLIAAGHFGEAARAYHADTMNPRNADSIGILMAAERQLNFADRMAQGIQAARHGHRGEAVHFPPTEQNVAEYFRSLRNRLPGDVVRELREYSSAFYVHHGNDGEMAYDPETHNIGGRPWPTQTPEDWSDVNDSREIRSDGRRLIDCEGFAYLGDRLLREAGFTNGRYVALSRADNPSTSGDESEVGHIVFTAQRDGHVAVVSNHQVELSDSNSPQFQGDMNRAREATLQRAIRGMGSVDGRGEAQTAWRADYELRHRP
jgi:hypothetical protein